MSSNLGDYIKERRHLLGITQAEMADRAGIPRTTANRIETGATKLPDAVARRALAQVLGIGHVDMLVAAGELARDEVEYRAPDDHPIIAAIRPIIGEREFTDKEMRDLTDAVRIMVRMMDGG